MVSDLDIKALVAMRKTELAEGGSKELWDHVFRDTPYRTTKGEVDKLLPFIRAMADVAIQVEAVEGIVSEMLDGHISAKPPVSAVVEKEVVAEEPAPVSTDAQTAQRDRLAAIRQAKKDKRLGTKPVVVKPSAREIALEAQVKQLLAEKLAQKELAKPAVESPPTPDGDEDAAGSSPPKVAPLKGRPSVSSKKRGRPKGSKNKPKPKKD